MHAWRALKRIEAGEFVESVGAGRSASGLGVRLRMVDLKGRIIDFVRFRNRVPIHVADLLGGEQIFRIRTGTGNTLFSAPHLVVRVDVTARKQQTQRYQPGEANGAEDMSAGSGDSELHGPKDSTFGPVSSSMKPVIT